jgi:hypothetical protein
VAVNLPYPIPDPATGQWDPFALKQDLEFLARSIDSVSTQNTVTLIRRDVGNPVKDIVNSSAETSLFATPLTILGGLFGTTRRTRLTVLFDHLNDSAATRTLTFRLKYGGQTLATHVSDITADATRYGGENLNAELTALGATNVQGARRIGPALANDTVTSNTVTAGSVDSTIAQTYDLTMQWGAANPLLSLRVQAISLEFL